MKIYKTLATVTFTFRVEAECFIDEEELHRLGGGDLQVASVEQCKHRLRDAMRNFHGSASLRLGDIIGIPHAIVETIGVEEIPD